MADSLRLKGCKSISKHTGDEMLLRRPKRGGDIFKVPTWWNLKHTTQYVSAAIFKVTSSKGELALVVPVDPETTDIIIKHDGDGGFTFPSVNGVDRVAVMAADLGTFYEEYQFSKISGGPVLKRTVNQLPAGATKIDSVTVTGNAGPVAGVAEQYTANVTGSAGNLTYSWSATGGTVNSSTGNSASITFAAAGAGRASVTVGSTDPNFDGDTVASFLDVTITATFAARVAAANFTYAVTVNNGEYELNGVANAGIAASAGDTIHFDLSDASLSGHPFKIYTDSTKTTEVTVGVEQDGDQLLFTPPIAGNFSYQCANHEDMGGAIIVN